MKNLAFASFLLFPVFCGAAIRMAITVDDLPRHGNLPPGITRKQVTQSMIAALQKLKVPEVYGFINAQGLDDKPENIEVLKLWRRAGYPLGNHTFSHMNINKNPVEDFKKEITKNEPILKSLAGATDWHYFRYPYLFEGDNLEKRRAVRAFLKERHYQIAQVSVDFEDWSWNDPFARCKTKGDEKSVDWLKKTYLESALARLDWDDKVAQAVYGRPIAHVLLLHIGAFDAEMMPELLKGYQDKGVQFIPLSEALKDPIYAVDPDLAYEYGAEIQFQTLKSRHQTTKDLGLTYISVYPEEKLKTVCRP